MQLTSQWKKRKKPTIQIPFSGERTSRFGRPPLLFEKLGSLRNSALLSNSPTSQRHDPSLKADFGTVDWAGYYQRFENASRCDLKTHRQRKMLEVTA
jgi:hypothetical protein